MDANNLIKVKPFVTNRFMLLCLLFTINQGFCQKTVNKDSVTHIKVKYTDGDYRFSPYDGYLFVGSKNKISITNAKNRAFEVKLSNGYIQKMQGDSTYSIDSLVSIGSTLLSIYEKDAKGKRRLVLNKSLKVIPFPLVKCAGVKSDSVITNFMLAVGNIYVEYKAIKKRIPINSFKMEYYQNGEFKTDSSNTSNLTKRMQAYVSKLKPGSLVILSKIKYTDPTGTEHTEPIYRVFIIKQANALQIKL